MTEHTIAVGQGNRAWCTCGQTFTGNSRTEALIKLLDHIDAEEAATA